jgi:predicted RNA-binding protein with PUA-like domain
MAKQWLIKSEPSTFSFSRLLKDGVTAWDGVRNYEARNNLRAMKLGDLALFYHSSEGKEVVGIARVKREAYQDPTTKEDWSAVDFEPVVPLQEAVTLAAIKENPKLGAMALVKKPRISVVPVTSDEFKAVLAMGKTKVPAGASKG